MRVRLILVRHAEAAPGSPDELRPPDTRRRGARRRQLGARLAAERPTRCSRARSLRARRDGGGDRRGGRRRRSEIGRAGSRRARRLDDVRALVDGARRDRSSSSAISPTAATIVLALDGRASVRFPPGGTCEVEL